MASVRRLASLVVFAWLTIHTAGVVAATFDAVDLSDAICTCAHDPGAECPMHHHGGDRTVCHWRSSPVALSPSMTLTFGPIGFAATPATNDVPAATDTPRPPVPALRPFDPPPTTPPPRG